MSDITNTMDDCVESYIADYKVKLTEELDEILRCLKNEALVDLSDKCPEELVLDYEYYDEVFTNHTDGELIDYYSICLDNRPRNELHDAVSEDFYGGISDSGKKLETMSFRSIKDVESTCKYAENEWGYDCTELLPLLKNKLRMGALE